MSKNSVAEFGNYSDFLKSYLKELPKSRGVLKAWATHLIVHNSLIIQVMMGKRNFAEGQASDLCDFIGLGTLEYNFFI